VPGAPSAPLVRSLDVTRDGVYSIVRNALSNGLAQFDVIMLGQLQPPEAVALYKVGKSLTSLPIKIAFPLWRMTQPRVMAAIDAGDHRVERRVILSGSLGFVLLMLAVLPFVLPLGADFIAFAYGEQYRAAFRYFLILMVGVWLFNGVTGWFAYWCVLSRSQLYGVLVYGVAFALLVVAGLNWGAASASHMAIVASGVLALASGLAFIGLYLPSRIRRED
jgi:O-antigen/teichoic acid export membrane protein